MSTWRDILTTNESSVVRLAEAYRDIYGSKKWNWDDPRLQTLGVLIEHLDSLQFPEPLPVVPWDQDLTNELATNDNCPGILIDGWWQRTIDQIDRVTIHHTYGWVDLHTFCEYYVNSKGGRPSSPYSIWITPTGQVILVNKLTEGCWHDHTGHENTHLSIGLAGSLHLHRPPDVQLQAAARVCKWVIENEDIPQVNKAEHVNGHDAYHPTACPGWDDRGEAAPSGYWRDAFFTILQDQLR